MEGNRRDQNLPRGVAPQARDQGNTQSSGNAGGRAAPQPINQDGPLAQKPTAELLEIFAEWNGLLEDQNRARRMILAKVSELTRELGARRAVHSNMWTTVWDHRNEYERVDRSLRQVMAPEPRATITHASNIGGSRNLSAGSGPTRQPNIDLSNVGSNVGLPSIPTSVVGPYAPASPRPSFPSAQGPFAPPPQRPSFPLAQGTTLAPTSGGNVGGGPGPKHTDYCGVVVAASTASTMPAPRANDQGQKKYKFHCGICNEAFRDQRRVYTHFPGCVRRNGNVNGAHWYDHPSIHEAKLPYGLLEE